MTQRIIICGDIHGCIEEFDELMRTVQYVKGVDKLILLGDHMDRGPDGVGVVRRAQEIGAESVMGNHDHSHLRWHRHEQIRKASGKPNPMKPFKPSQIAENEAFSEQDIAWLAAQPLTIRLPNNWVAVHGGFEPNKMVEDQSSNDMIRMRYLDKDTLKPVSLGDEFVQPPNSIFWSLIYRGPEHVVYGHAVQGDKPFHYRRKVEPPFELFRDSYPDVVNTVGLDTGACFGLALTCLVTTDEFATWEYVQVKSKQNYAGKDFIPVFETHPRWDC